MKKKETFEFKEKEKWYSRPYDYALEKTNSSINGLTTLEAETRLKENGKNTLPQKKPTSIFKLLFEELINPIILILLVASHSLIY